MIHTMRSITLIGDFRAGNAPPSELPNTLSADRNDACGARMYAQQFNERARSQGLPLRFKRGSRYFLVLWSRLRTAESIL